MTQRAIGVTFLVSVGDGLAHNVGSRWEVQELFSSLSRTVVNRIGFRVPTGPTLCGLDADGGRITSWDEGLPTCMSCVKANLNGSSE